MKYAVIIFSLLVIFTASVIIIIQTYHIENPVTGTNSVATPVVHVVYPTMSSISKSEHVVSNVKNFDVKQISDDIQNNNSKGQSIKLNTDLLFGIFQQAEAISSTQSTITITQTNLLNTYQPSALDPSGNVFTFSVYQVSRFVPSTQVQTSWTIPNNDAVDCISESITADSLGNAYFVERSTDNTGTIGLARLNPSTNVFTEWIPSSGTIDCESQLVTDSSNNVYFTSRGSAFLNQLNPSTNSITTWSQIHLSNYPSSATQMIIDQTKTLYFTGTDSNGTSKIFKFIPSTNTLTEWATLLSASNLAQDSSGNIFFTEVTNTGVTKIAELSPSTNTITEWTIPFAESTGPITVDSSGNVFVITNEDVVRLVPSTNTFTKWSEDGAIGASVLIANPSGTLTFSGYSSGTIS